MSWGRWMVAVAVLAAAAESRADDGGPSDRERKVARESVYQGDDFVKRGDYKRALEAYQRANDIMKVPSTAIEVVRTSLKLGLLVEALAACEQTAAFPEKPGEPPQFTAARNEALKLITGLHARIPQVAVGVLTPDGAPPQVVVDGKAVKEFSHIALNPGTHSIDASSPGLVSAHEEITLDEGETKRIELVLRAPVSTVVTTKAPSTYWPLVFTGFGMTLAGAGVGTATGILSLKAADELAAVCRKDASCPPNQGLESTIERRNTFATISTATFAAAGVGAVIAIPSLVYSLRAKRQTPKENVAVGPMFDANGALVPGATVTLW